MNGQAHSARFLARFFANTQHAVELRALPSRARCFTRKPNEVERFIQEHTGENVYFGCATRDGGGTKEHCREVPALWADVDFKVTPEAFARELLKKFPVRPSLLIESGGGLHIYWALVEPVLAFDPRVEPILHGLAERLGADPAAAEVARIMRLPGTVNHKYDPPRECRLAEEHRHFRYALEDFERFAARYNRNPAICDDHDVDVTEGGRNTYLVSVAGTMRRRGCSVPAIEAALLAENPHRCKPPLPESEVRNIATSIGRYEPGFINGPDSFHSAHIEKEFGQKPFPGEKGLCLPFKTAAQIERETPPEVAWLAKPYVPLGAITEADGKVKLAGKTTFVTHLCRAVLDGTPFMQQPTMKSAVVYLTEQPPSSWRLALSRAGILGREDFSCLYFKDIRGIGWQAVADASVAECKRIGARLLVVDTLSQFAGISGDSENDAGEALRAMSPLQAAAGDGIAVIVVRHERKSGGEVVESGRGSSAFGGAVDIVLSIRRPEGNTRNTLRVILAEGRFDETPEKMVVELTSHGYVALGSEVDVAVAEAGRAILAAVPASLEDALDLDALVKSTDTKRATAQRAINKLRGEGVLLVTGKGKRGDPWRYYAPGRERSQDRASDSFCPNFDAILGRSKSAPLENASAASRHQDRLPLPHQNGAATTPTGKPMIEANI